MPDSSLADGSYLTSSFYESYIRPQVIVACTSSTRPTGVEGRRIYETDTDKEYVYDGSSWVEMGRSGAWTSWTPTITQSGSVAFTNTYSRYVRFGRTVICMFNTTVTGSGTAGQPVTVSLPVNSAGAYLYPGSGYLYDASAVVRYGGQWLVTGSSSLVFVGDWAGANSWGTTPSIGLASDDQLMGTITYEAAS